MGSCSPLSSLYSTSGLWDCLCSTCWMPSHALPTVSQHLPAKEATKLPWFTQPEDLTEHRYFHSFFGLFVLRNQCGSSLLLYETHIAEAYPFFPGMEKKSWSAPRGPEVWPHKNCLSPFSHSLCHFLSIAEIMEVFPANSCLCDKLLCPLLESIV